MMSTETSQSEATLPARAAETVRKPRRAVLGRYAPLVALVLAAGVPFCTLPVPGILGGPVNSAGSLQLLASCLLFAGLAVGYDLLFNRVGLLSFGHALYVTLGAYGAELAMSRLGLGLAAAAVLSVALGTTLAALLGAVSLRARALGGIGFAMVTLAFAQAGSVLITTDPAGLTGGEEGLALAANRVPDFLIGVANTAHLYWLALAYLALCAAVVWSACASPLGRVWQAVRDNESRVAVLGMNPRRYQLGALVLAGALGSLGGVVQLLLTAGATAQISTTTFTLSLLVMVVLGGSGNRWGPLLGAVLYTVLDQRLTALSSTSIIQRLPAVLRAPLSQPLVVLGAFFVVIVFVLPGGLVALPGRLRHPKRDRTSEQPSE